MYDEIPGKNDNSVQTMLCNKMYAFGTSCGQQMWHAEYWVQNKNKNYHFILVQQVISLNCKQWQEQQYNKMIKIALCYRALDDNWLFSAQART